MGKFLFVACVLLSTGIGFMLGIDEGVESAIGYALFWWLIPGIVLGLSVSNIGRKADADNHHSRDDDDALGEDLDKAARLGGQGTSPEELEANYWRDEGHPPFMNPEDYDPDA